MKSKHLLLMLLLALLAPWAANAQETVTIGDGTTNNYYTPIGTYYNYSITEQLYTAEEIGMAGTINSISFNYAGTTAKDFTITVYMKNVEASDLSTAGISLADAEVVFEGTFSVTGAGWATITLDNPFEYDGSSNLLIGFKKDAPSWYNNGKWYYTEASGMARYSQQDGSTPYTTSTVPGTMTSHRPNIQIEITPAPAGSCERPETLTVLNITPNTARLEWSYVNASFNVEYKKTSETDWTRAYSSIGQNCMLYNLDPATTYNVRVQSVCGGSEESGWKTANFTTADPCAAPTDLQITNITPNSATLSWTAGYQETTWTLKYKKSTRTEWESETVNGTPSIILNGLDGLTTYNVQVLNCTEDGDPYLSGNFTTAAGIPLIESFGTSIPTAWSMYTGLLSNVMGGTPLNTATYGWNFGTGSNGVFDNHVSVNIYGGSCNRWLVMPALLMEDNVQLTFDMALTNYNGTLQEINKTLGEDDRFIVLITTDGGTTWDILREWNNTGSTDVYNDIACTATGQAVSIDLSSYAGQNIQIAFYGESTVNESGSDNNLHIDNVRIDYIPSCAIPTALTRSNVTAHTADLAWTAGDAETAWQICVNDDEENLIDVTETSYQLTGLDGSTAYSVKVRANCGGTNSEWTNAVSFTTLVSCPVPTSFTTSNVGAHSVELSWASDASEWVVAYKKTADENFTEVTVTEKPYTLEGLDPEINYTVKVKAVCGGIDGESQYTTTRSFTTTVACPAPSTPIVSNLTATSATISWTELGDGTSWFICLDGEDDNLIEVDETTYTFPALETETVHTVKVKSNCGTAWSSVVSFEPTAKLVIGSGSATSNNLPSNTNYDYSYTQQIYTTEELGNAGVFESIDFYMTSTTDYTRNLDIYMVSTDKESFTSNTDWIVPTAADLVFSGDVDFTGNSWTTITLDEPFVYNGTQNVAIIVDDNTNAWSSRSFRVFTASAQQALYKYRDDNDLPIDYAESGTLTTSKNQIRILKSEMSNCMKPMQLTATEIGPDFIKLSWTENGASTEWVVVYNGNTTTANTNTNFMLQGLANETEYTITVYPTCDPTLVSSAITITTLAGCPAPQNVVITNIGSHSATVTWTGFSDNYTVTLGQESTPAEIINVDFSDGIPSSWDNTSAYPWEVTTDGYIQTTNAGVGSSTSSLSVEVTFPVDGTITFDAECRGEGTGTFWDHCDFFIDGNRVFYHGEDLTNAGWNTYTFVVTAGTHTFTWSYTKDSSVDQDGDYFAIDNVLASYTTVNWGTPVTGILNEEYEAENLAADTRYFVKVQGFCGLTPSEESAIATFTTEIACPAPTNLDYANVTAHTADLTWNVNGNTTTDYVLIQNGTESNIVVTIDEGVASYTIQNLVGETDYTVSVKANCGSEDGYSTESNEVTFTTLEACAKPTDLEAIDITRHEATLTWDGTASSYNVRYRVLTATNGVTEDFEGSVDGWTSIDADGDGSNWELTNSVPAHNGEYCVLSASYEGVALTPDNYLVSPLVALGGSISFYANAQDADWPSEHFGVAVSTTSNTDPDAFILLNEWTMTAAGTPAGAKDQGAWGLYTVDLSAYAGQSGYVAIRHFNCTDLFRLNVDDIVITAPTGIVEPDWIEATVSTNSMDIDELAAGTLYEFEVQSDCGAEGTSNWAHSTFATEIGCLPVTDLAVTATTSTSATITWNAGTGTAWQVYLYDNNDNVLSGYPVDVTTATCTFNGLTANTPYKAGVKNNCGGVDISAEVFVSMRTDCNIITTLPYEESFEGAERYCWTLDGFAAENAAGHAHTDNYYIYANGYDATHMAIQPDIDAEISGLAMNFWYKCRYENAYETLKVGYLTDVNDYSSFVEVGSIVMTAANNGVYTQSQDFFFTGAPAGSRIAISYVSSGTGFNNMVFIDDVKISEPSTVTKNIVANNWYALSSPVNTPNVTDVNNLTVDDYDFYRYNEVTSTWENYKAHRSSNFTTFENGRGYIYRRSNTATLTFTGVPNTATDYPYLLTAEGSGDLAGFNLLGNPFANSYTYSGNCYALTEKGTWMAKTNYTISVCEAVLVKVSSEVNYPYLNSKSAPKAVEALAFTVSGNGYEDVTYAMLEEGEGLNKVAHLATEAPALSIPVDGSNYAIAYLGYEVESFPLTLNATAGEYTIALNNQISGLSYCHLLDKETGKETDLLKGAYTFKANGNSDRFTVLLNASLENGEIAIWNGNSWIVNGEGTLQVFDVMGRRVYNQEVAGQSSLNTDELATGVYVIRLGEKSQKIVVK